MIIFFQFYFLIENKIRENEMSFNFIRENEMSFNFIINVEE